MRNRINRIFFLLGALILLVSCEKKIQLKYLDQPSVHEIDTVSIVFENGFVKTHVQLKRGNITLLDSVLNTDESSGLASEFIGLVNSEGNSELSLKIENYKLLKFPINFKYQTTIIRIENNQALILMTNKSVNYE